ncbi:lycopene cyclase domain-containing protein [Jatrophihabitans sp. GAS493]|uniref:lycopene cyclase domain-containing protein n=1 Tax=Jatrophihabitans sp. GAS493 TaxID=1907575 RepID=UPI000BC05AD7|nr:lycopene cyclase domain-containing protein [Jatrophihabitans sp. GAS493]SOD74354.1 lycopene cyclase domain-containing protein [Jatrophihabitans sp. GAS493]
MSYLSYTGAAAVMVVLAVVLDCLILKTILIRRRAFWTAYAIVLLFQLLTNAVLTGLPVVRYNADRILGPRIAYAPVEDLFFGFSMILTTLAIWVWLGATRAPRPERRPGRAEEVPPPPES